MGWAYYLIDGRPCGYSVEAECDKEGCGTRIDRGLYYLCGDLPGDDNGCGSYFCDAHTYDHDCEVNQ